MELTQEQLLALEELWCRPHRWLRRDEGPGKDLVEMGLYKDHVGAGIHPLTLKGKRVVHEVIASGNWPPSKHGMAVTPPGEGA